MTEDEMVGWYHRLNGHEFEQTQEDSERQGSLVCRVTKNRTWLSNWTTTTTHFLKGWGGHFGKKLGYSDYGAGTFLIQVTSPGSSVSAKPTTSLLVKHPQWLKAGLRMHFPLETRARSGYKKEHPKALVCYITGKLCSPLVWILEVLAIFPYFKMFNLYSAVLSNVWTLTAKSCLNWFKRD